MISSKPFLDGRTALITGAALRLGDRIARDLALHGANIVANYHHSTDSAFVLVDQLKRMGRGALAVQADITKEDAVALMVRGAIEAFGSIDILVHNAGPFTETPLKDLPIDLWDAILNTNLKGALLVSKAVQSGMKRKGWGRIINISAGSAFSREASVYGLAKAALNALTQALALELAPEVTVNAVAPGMIDDPEVDVDLRLEARATTPTMRLVTYEEVARMVTLFCTADFANVTGQVLCIDGGQSLPRIPRRMTTEAKNNGSSRGTQRR